MSFLLTDRGDPEKYLPLNVWHWHTILAMIQRLGILPKEKIEELGINVCPELSRDEARTIAKVLRERVIPCFAADDRVFIEGTLTKEPDDGAFYRNALDRHKNYSTTRAVLLSLCSLLEACDGIIIY